MLKKIISLLLVLTFIPVFAIADEESNIVINEIFDNYATNGQSDTLRIKSGNDAAVVMRDSSDKAFYSKTDGANVKFTIPTGDSYNKMVFSYDIKTKGDFVSGGALIFKDSSASMTMFSYNKDGSITLEDGMKLSGYKDGFWHTYTVVVDFVNKSYDLYKDGKAQFKNHYFSGSVVSPKKEIEFSFAPLEEKGVTEVWIDNIYAYEGTKLPKDMNLPKKAYNSETVDPNKTQTDAKVYDTVFLDTNGRAGYDKVGFASSKTDNYGDWKAPIEGTTPAMHFVKEGSQDMFSTITIPRMYDDLDAYVYQIDVYPVANPTATINAGTINAQGGAYCQLVRIDKNRNLVIGNEVVCPIEYEKWTTITAVVNMNLETVDMYVNGVLKADDYELPDNGAVLPNNIRLGFSSGTPAGEFNEVYFNRLKFYDGLTIREFDDEEITTDGEGKDFEILQAMKVTKMEKDAEGIALLADDVAFMGTNEYFYANGQKQKYSLYGKDAYVDENGSVMVDAKVLAYVKGVEAVSSGDGVTIGDVKYASVKKDGADFIMAAKFLRDNYTYVYDTDLRGIVLGSNSHRGYVNKLSADDNFDDIDVIWRYLQFDRPSGEDLYEAVTSGKYYKSHPRLLITKDEIPALRTKVENSPVLKEILVDLLKTCDGYIERGKPVEYKLAGIRLLSACHAVRDRLFDLTTAYILTGDEKYAEWGWIEMENALTVWPDWNISQHYLDTGGISPGIALGYDVFYDYLTDEQKKIIRDALTEKMIDYAVGVYTGESKYDALGVNHAHNNWGAVIGAGMFMNAITLIDEEAPNSPLTAKCKYLAANALQTFELLQTISAPEGSWWEGIGYYEYFMQSWTWTMQSLVNTCGTDYNAMSAMGMNKLPLHAIDIQTRLGCFNRDSQTNVVIQFAPEVMHLCNMYGDEEMEALCNEYNSYLGEKDYAARYLLFADPSKRTSDGKINLPLDRVYNDTGIAILRGAWNDTNAAYVGICAGITEEMYGINTHFDKGSFIFEHSGERWIVDMGRDSSSPSPLVKRAEIHSVPVINPTAEYTGQDWGGDGVFPIKQELKDRGAMVIYDMAPVYKNQVTSYKRGFMLGENRNTLTVQDEMVLSKPSDIEWNLITKADIEISADKKSVTLIQDGKRAKIEFYCNAADWHIEERDCIPLTGAETDIEKEFCKSAKKITLVTNVNGDLKVAAKIIPQVKGESFAPFSYMPLDDWYVEDGAMDAKAEVAGIYADGVLLEDFMPGIKEYDMTLVYGQAIPQFTATGDVGTITVKQSAAYTEPAEITITMPDGKTGTYKVNFKVNERTIDRLMEANLSVGLPDNAAILPVASVYATDEPQAQNPATGAVDGKLDTRWSSPMKGAYLEIDLGDVYNLSGIAMAFMSGHERNYMYDILVSEDKMNYTRVYTGMSTGTTEGYEFLELPVKARYVRYVANGYKDGTGTVWNSILEMRPAIAK